MDLPGSSMRPTTLRQAACAVLMQPDPWLKADMTQAIVRAWRSGELQEPSPQHVDSSTQEPCSAPSRPARADDKVRLVAPEEVPKLGKGGTLASRQAIVHSLCHIESWAVDLAWDIIARFGCDPAWAPYLPRAFYDDFVTVADDECRHFLLLVSRLKALGSEYGALPAHDGLWESAATTAHSLAARLAVEHCVHEARGLDILPNTIFKFKNNKDDETAMLLEGTVLPEEVQHCAAGVRWLQHLYQVAIQEQDGEEASRPSWMQEARQHPCVEQWFHALVRGHFRGQLKPPFNTLAREQAGFTPAWYLPLSSGAAVT